MRDINRIDKFCDELKVIWKKNPDWRFFQLMNNIMRIANSDLFYVEDDKALELMKNIFEEE